MLITHWCFSGCKPSFAQNQGLFYSLYCPSSKELVVHRKLGENKLRYWLKFKYCMFSCRMIKLEDAREANIAQGEIGHWSAGLTSHAFHFLLLTKLSLSQLRSSCILPSSFLAHRTGGWAVNKWLCKFSSASG